MEITTSAGTQVRRSSRTAPRIIVGMVAAVILVWGGWWGFKRVAWWTPAGHDIAQVVRGAAVANWTVLSPPLTGRRAPVTAAELYALSRTAQRKLADYYTGSSLTNWRAVARRTLRTTVLRPGTPSAWMTQWRVDWVHLGELALLPGSATATVSVELQSSDGIVNRADDNFHLVLTNTGWRIDRDSSEYQPGYGP